MVAAAHAHALYSRTWSSLGRRLDPITQDACAFYQDQGLYEDYTGVVLDAEEGKRLAYALGPHKAVILRNHGILTVGHSVDEAAWWYISMESCARSQLLAEAAGRPTLIGHDSAAHTAGRSGRTASAGSPSSRSTTGLSTRNPIFSTEPAVAADPPGAPGLRLGLAGR